MSEPGAHILVFPYPAQGHMIPLLDLTHQLAALGLTVTVFVTPKNLPLLNPLLAANPSSVAALVLPFPTHPAIPAGVENTVDLPAGGFRSMMFALSELQDPLLRWFRGHPSPPTAIISDMFLGWTHRLACQLSIRRFVFCPSGAFAMSVINSLWVEMPKRRNGEDQNETVSFPEIPNSPNYPWWQISPIYRSYVEGDPVSEFLQDTFRSNVASNGMVLNTFRELESVYLDYLVKELGHDRVWAVGPVSPPTEVGLVERGGSSSIVVNKIRSWLDACEDGTVVYVCFGSQAVLTNEQMGELTLGLEKSGVKFILVVKGATKGHEGREGEYGAIPLGFEDRVSERGLVIRGWAPQVEILRHKAVCAFLTHCGWNSALESVVAGVPMLAWPMGADQFVNADLLVDQLDIAIRVCEGAESMIDSDELARVLVEATGEKWMQKRARALSMSKAALGAIGEGGSSFSNLDTFVRQIQDTTSK